MLFKRKIYSKLLEWKNIYHGEKALLIEGARRIGKTTIAEDFARKEYSSYLLVDFSKVDDDFKSLFSNLKDMNEFFAKFFLALGENVLPKHSLIIFDEVQLCPLARQSIKSLVADGRYDYIETGSLISLHHPDKQSAAGKHNMLPSEEKKIQMYPLDYEEFRWAFNDVTTVSMLKDIFAGKKPYSIITRKVHQKLMADFQIYLALGGMPKVLDIFIKTNSFKLADEEKKDILSLYKDDLSDVDIKETTLCRPTFDLIPSQLNKPDSKNFTLSKVFPTSKSAKYLKTVTYLKDSMTVNMVNDVSDPRPGLAATAVPTKFKLFSSDTGLLVSQFFLEEAYEGDDLYQKLVLGNLKANLGMICENYVAQTLVANSHNPFYHIFTYDKDPIEKKYEIDFLIYRNGKIIPIEVKSSKVFSFVSLTKFKEKYSQTTGECYVFSPNMPKKDQGINFLPLYMAVCL